MYLLIEILISILFSLIPWLILKDKKYKSSFKIVSSIIILIGCLSRLTLIEKFPTGFNQDEASIGYEAYSILNYGIDRNGFSIPVHFVAWGSGQNALYAYLIMPFIKIFGLNEFSCRLPMAIIGCLSLVLFFIVLKDRFNCKNILIATFIFAIIPWHIMKSRWGLESNLFPDLIFISSLLFIMGSYKNKKRYFIIGSIILGLSTYSYGTSYLFVPIFVLLIFIYLVIKKKIFIRDAIIYTFLIGLISLPMILFVIINYFDLDTITILNITIPKLEVNRFTQITSVNGNFITNCIQNLHNSIKIILTQQDGLPLNTIKYYGTMYSFSLIFIIIGFVCSIKDKNEFLIIINCSLIASIFVAFFTNPNINRINVIWIPLIINLVYGIISVCNNQKLIMKIVMITYIIFFLAFMKTYFTTYQSDIGNSTFNGLGKAIKFSKKLDYHNLYIDESINQPYIYYLFYSKMDPNEYIKNRKILERNAAFQDIKSIKNVNFHLPKNICGNNAYIMSTDNISRYTTENYKINFFNNFVIIYK